MLLPHCVLLMWSSADCINGQLKLKLGVINSAVNSDKLEINEILCDKLKVHYQHLYARFCVQIRVNSSDIKDVSDLFMSNESWPDGIFVWRYSKPKHQQMACNSYTFL